MEVGEQLPGADRVTIRRADPPHALPPSTRPSEPIAELEVRTPAYGPTTVRDVLHRHHARSLVVVHQGHLVHEWYAPGEDPGRRNRCYSLTKSFTGTLAALAVHDGRLDRGTPVTTLLPELADSGFATATVAEIADMTASIAYDEDYTDAGDAPTGGRTTGFADYMVALGLIPPGPDLAPDTPRSIRALLARIAPGAGPHGRAFAYATPTADVLGWIVERAFGAPYAEVLQDRIWARIGAEHNAVLSLDPAGVALTGGGLGMTTRDLARFGLVFTGCGAGGADPVVPAAVTEQIRRGGEPDAFSLDDHYAYLTGYTYRDQWWLPGGPSRPISAWGIHGQLLWVDPDVELVIASHGGGPHASDERRDLEQDALCRALTDLAATWPGHPGPAA